MIEKKIIDALNYEWERFYLDCMRTSKSNIFAKSSEIEIKKKITFYLKNILPEIDEAALAGLTVQDNIMESVYRYILDYLEDGSIEELIQKYIISLQEGELNAAE